MPSVRCFARSYSFVLMAIGVELGIWRRGGINIHRLNFANSTGKFLL